MSAQPAAAGDPAQSVDAFLGGLVTLVQPTTGHRAGLDAALLQATAPADARGCAIDLGSGVGTVAFCVAARAPGLSAVAVERDAKLLDCGRAALLLPGNAAFADRIRLVEMDVTSRRDARERAGLPDGSADIVLMNPPYDRADRVRPSPDAGRRSAHLAQPGALGAWCRAAAGLLRPGGTVAIIHRVGALPNILEVLSGRFGEARVLPVHPVAGEPASRILIRARKGSRAGLQLLPGLALHEPGGAWTAEAADILHGRGGLHFA